MNTLTEVSVATWQPESASKPALIVCGDEIPIGEFNHSSVGVIVKGAERPFILACWPVGKPIPANDEFTTVDPATWGDGVRVELNKKNLPVGRYNLLVKDATSPEVLHQSTFEILEDD